MFNISSNIVRSLVCDDKGPSLNSEESKPSLTETGLQVSMYYDVYCRIIGSWENHNYLVHQQQLPDLCTMVIIIQEPNYKSLTAMIKQL